MSLCFKYDRSASFHGRNIGQTSAKPAHMGAFTVLKSRWGIHQYIHEKPCIHSLEIALLDSAFRSLRTGVAGLSLLVHGYHLQDMIS